MILYWYFTRKFISAFIRVFLIIGLLIFFVDTMENIKNLSSAGITLPKAIALASTRSPSFIREAMPLIIMLSSLTFCVSLARTNEFIILRAAGVSALKGLGFPILAAFLIGLISILFLNPLVATFSAHYDSLKNTYLGRAEKTVSVNENGFWLRQKTENGYIVITANQAAQNGNSLRDVTMIRFDENNKAVSRISASTAMLSKGEWILIRTKQWDISSSASNPEASSTKTSIIRVPTTITSEQILEGYPKPETVVIWDLPKFIKAMDNAGFSSRQHRVHLQIELARPLLFAAMIIIGAVFTLQNARLGNLGISVLLALLSGFSLHFLQNLARTLGEAGEIPIFFAAWAPPLAALLTAMALFLHLEDG
ncbi:MAG: LPS export ABC transporter permease LptG [Amylibacter sp.]|nr:LPS export ABC transporter permease LptG [Amylibacter sp.]